MSVIFGDELQEIWTTRLNDPIVFNMLIKNNRAFLSHGLVEASDIPFIFNPEVWYVWRLLPECLRVLIPVPPLPTFSKELLYQCAVIYALIDKLILKKNKGYNSPPCVDVCLCINNFNTLALAKTGVFIPTYHNLLKAEFKKFQVKDNKKTIPPVDCKIVNCKSYKDRIGKNYADCCNVLGNCAEQKAADEILKEPRCGALTLADLRFSWALRPRTMEIIPYCYNCTEIFPQLK